MAEVPVGMAVSVCGWRAVRLDRQWLPACYLLSLFLAVAGCDEQAVRQVAVPPGPVVAPPVTKPPPSRSWSALADDRIHDPTAPGLGLLQQPQEALSLLPEDRVGNQVRWVEAIDKGIIEPRTRLYPKTEIQLRTTAIYLDIGGRAGIVRFPHREHSIWLDCRNCHDELFRQEAGATLISMNRILEGEKCGRCHGAVSFPLTECSRCHSIAQSRIATLLDRDDCRRTEADKLVLVCDD